MVERAMTDMRRPGEKSEPVLARNPRSQSDKKRKKVAYAAV